LTTFVEVPPEGLPAKLSGALKRVHELIEAIATLDAQKRPDDVFWFLWEELDYLRDAVAREEEDALDAVAAFGQAIERFSDRRPGKRFDDYLAVLQGVEFGPEPWPMPEERRPDSVRLMTAHTP